MRILQILLAIVIAILIIGAGTFWWLERVQTMPSSPLVQLPGGTLEDMSSSYVKIISSADVGAVQQMPLPTKVVGSAQEAQEAMSAGQLHYAFRLASSTTAYLVSVLDSQSPEVDPYKSSAAYNLLHTYYETHSFGFLTSAVDTSVFMKEQIVPKAAAYFPDLFSKATSTIKKSSERNRYFVGLLLAVGERDDSIAAPATASHELMHMYVDATSTKERTMLHDLALKEYQTALTRLSARLYRSTEPVSAYDTLIGINHLAIATDYARSSGIADTFPEMSQFDIVSMMSVARPIAWEEVYSLRHFTDYLALLYSVKYLPAGPENDAKIDAIAQNIVGKPDALQKGPYSFAMQSLVRTKDAGYEKVFRRQNLAIIAKRSTTMRLFLEQVDGWTAADFADTK